jgi:hypothetical protein
MFGKVTRKLLLALFSAMVLASIALPVFAGDGGPGAG